MQSGDQIDSIISVPESRFLDIFRLGYVLKRPDCFDGTFSYRCLTEKDFVSFCIETCYYGDAPHLDIRPIERMSIQTKMFHPIPWTIPRPILASQDLNFFVQIECVITGVMEYIGDCSSDSEYKICVRGKIQIPARFEVVSLFSDPYLFMDDDDYVGDDIQHSRIIISQEYFDRDTDSSYADMEERIHSLYDDPRIFSEWTRYICSDLSEKSAVECECCRQGLCVGEAKFRIRYCSGTIDPTLLRSEIDFCQHHFPPYQCSYE
jgi:hypothetical protein